MNRIQIGLSVLLSFFAIACNTSGPPPNPDKLSEALNDPAVVVLDVRSPGEYEGGHVPGAVNLPIDDISDAPSVLKDKSAPIVVHCATGVRSAQAMKWLAAQGYTRIIDAQSPETVAKAMGVQLQK